MKGPFTLAAWLNTLPELTRQHIQSRAEALTARGGFNAADALQVASGLELDPQGSANSHQAIRVDLPHTETRAVEIEGQLHLQMLCGSTAVDSYRTFISPELIPVFRAQATKGLTALRITHDRTHPFPLGISTGTIPAESWDAYPWEELQTVIQAESPDDVLIYDFLLRTDHPYYSMLQADLQAGVPFSASMGMCNVARRSVVLPNGQVVQALVGNDAWADHVALIYPQTGANPDTNHGVVTLRDIFQGVQALSLQEVGEFVDQSRPPDQLYQDILKAYRPSSVFSVHVNALENALRQVFWTSMDAEMSRGDLSQEFTGVLDAFREAVLDDLFEGDALRARDVLEGYFVTTTVSSTSGEYSSDAENVHDDSVAEPTSEGASTMSVATDLAKAIQELAPEDRTELLQTLGLTSESTEETRDDAEAADEAGVTEEVSATEEIVDTSEETTDPVSEPEEVVGQAITLEALHAAHSELRTELAEALGNILAQIEELRAPGEYVRTQAAMPFASEVRGAATRPLGGTVPADVPTPLDEIEAAQGYQQARDTGQTRLVDAVAGGLGL